MDNRTPPVTPDIARPAAPLRPNTSSCGSQSAHISLTAPPVDHDAPAGRTGQGTDTKERSTTSQSWTAHPCPLDKERLHISCTAQGRWLGALLTEEINNTRTKLPGARRPLHYQIAEARMSTKIQPVLQEV